MIALIADGERGMRTVLRRVLQQLDVEALEAENGLELLCMLEEGSWKADLVVVDIDMPIMNGLETLRAIRASEKYRNIPVVCTSAVGDSSVIRQVIEIGISDLLLKPVRHDFAVPRLRAVLSGSDRRRQQLPAPSAAELLIVEPDPNFLAFAKPLLAAHFTVIEATSAPRAAMLFQERNPSPRVVLLPEGLPVIDELQMAATLRRIAAWHKADPPEIFLLTQGEAIAPEKLAQFHGVIRKTFVPEQFASALEREVLKVISPSDHLRELLAGELIPEVHTATQQTIGVLTGQDAIPLNAEEAAALELPVRSTLTLGTAESGVRLEVSLLSDEPSVLRLSAKMLGMEVSMDEGAADVLNELTNTVAGRIRASLLTRNLDLKMGLPVGSIDTPAMAATSWSQVAAFRSISGELMLVGLRIPS
ncbi:MAG: response regulator [Gemmatimonadales bacterium]